MKSSVLTPTETAPALGAFAVVRANSHRERALREPVLNPKRNGSETTARSTWFSYYAGFSAEFVADILRRLSMPDQPLILDPWNGSGTTTTTAWLHGLHARGLDLNPAMVLVARARLLAFEDRLGVVKRAHDVVSAATRLRSSEASDGRDPLATWLTPVSAGWLRKLETQVANGDPARAPLCKANWVQDCHPRDALLYVALFRTLRQVLQPFRSSNPTWFLKPNARSGRLRPSPNQISQLFLENTQTMLRDDLATSQGVGATWDVRLGDSRAMSFGDRSFDAVITSPPYCTRLDYVVATSPELAILGIQDADRARLRRAMLGTPTASDAAAVPLSRAWGATCLRLLRRIYSHSSKASSGYYYRTHVAYYSGLFSSLREIARVLKPGGDAILVVQDSYYKNLHNDLPAILVEMANSVGLCLGGRWDFAKTASLARVNPRHRTHRRAPSAVESVLWLRRVVPREGRGHGGEIQ